MDQGFPEPREGPQGTQKKIDRAIFAALGLRFGPRHRSRDLLGGHLGRRTRSWDPLGTFLKPLEAKNEIVNISLVLPSKFEPWRTLADPGPPKKAPHGPDRFFGGPPRRLQGRSPENTKAPGRPLGRQILVSEPSLANPRNYKDENYKKNVIFSKIAGMPIFITILAPMEKPLPLQNARLGFRGPPLDPPWVGTLFLGTPPERPGGGPFPPGTPPGLPQDQPWRPQGLPKSPQGGPGAPKGHIKSTK